MLLVETSHWSSNNLSRWHLVAYGSRKMILKLDTKFDTKLMIVSFFAIIES